MKKILALICFCSLAACAPPPKTTVDIQTDKLIVHEKAAAAKVDGWESEAIKTYDRYQADAANLYQHCSWRGVMPAKLDPYLPGDPAVTAQAQAECTKAWDDIK